MAIARAKNRQGEPGKNGDNGKDAVQPKFSVGEVSSGDEARVWLTGSLLKPVLNFVLPRGKKGEPGKPGDPGKNGITKIIQADGFAAGGGSGSGSGDIFEAIPVLLNANVWQTVTPTTIAEISDCEVYDDGAAERIEVDIRFNPARSQIELKSKVTLTVTLFLEGK